jgi:hypothetical protein
LSRDNIFYYELAVSVAANCTVNMVLREGKKRKTKKEGMNECGRKKLDSCSGYAEFSFCIMP